MIKQPSNFLLTSFGFSLLSTFRNITKMTSKRPRWVYSEDSMANAMLEVTDNNIFLTQAAGKHGVPKQTLSDRIKGQRASADQIQPQARLSKDQEAYLVLWILRQESLGYAPSH
jgi:hypothetical protein